MLNISVQMDHAIRTHSNRSVVLASSAVGLGQIVSAGFVTVMAAQVILAVTGTLVLLLAFCFRELTVRDEGESISIRFGPIPLFRRRVVYANIQRAQHSRTTILDGWGIHFSPKGGITWNIWGFDCVDVYFHNGRRLRIGTDDPDGLEAFLQQRIPAAVDART